MTVAHNVMSGVAGRIVPPRPELSFFEGNVLYGPGGYSHTYDFSNRPLTAEGTEYFIDPLGGSDSNSGLTVGAKLKSLNAAVAKSDFGVATIDQGSVLDNSLCQFNIPTVNRKVIIRSSGSQKVKLLGCNLGLVWTAHPTLPGVYQCSTTAVTAVRDTAVLDGRGLASRYSTQTSEVDVGANDGSWCWSAGTLTLKPLDRPPGDHLRVNLDSSRFVFRHGFRQTLKGIECEGFFEQGFRATNSTTFIHLDVIDGAFRYCDSDNNGVRLLGVDAHFQSTIAEGNKKDGFNPHNNGGRDCNIFTDSCIGRHNGWDGADTNNGLTNHEGGRTLDLNSQFYGNEGPNVSVAGTTPFSVLFGTQAWGSTRASVKNNYTSGNGKMLLAGCISGLPNDFDSQTSGSGTIFGIGQVFNNTGSGYTHGPSLEWLMAQ